MICLFDEDEPQYSEHDIAWLSKDWDAVQKLADSYKEKPENELFLVLNNININKNELFVGNLDSYSKFAIDNMLSKSVDCIQDVYIANMLIHGLSDQSHYNYLLNCISPAKRYAKNVKIEDSVKDKFINLLLKKYYCVSMERALEYRDILERKDVLNEVLKKCKGFVTDDFIKSITKNAKEQKSLKVML